jgi:hypothetical protein
MSSSCDPIPASHFPVSNVPEAPSNRDSESRANSLASQTHCIQKLSLSLHSGDAGQTDV